MGQAGHLPASHFYSGGYPVPHPVPLSHFSVSFHLVKQSFRRLMPSKIDARLSLSLMSQLYVPLISAASRRFRDLFTPPQAPLISTINFRFE